MMTNKIVILSRTQRAMVAHCCGVHKIHLGVSRLAVDYVPSSIPASNAVAVLEHSSQDGHGSRSSCIRPTSGVPERSRETPPDSQDDVAGSSVFAVSATS